MATNIDESTDQLPILQSSFSTTAPIGSTGIIGGKGGKTKISAKSSDNLKDSSLTVSQQSLGH